MADAVSPGICAALFVVVFPICETNLDFLKLYYKYMYINQFFDTLFYFFFHCCGFYLYPTLLFYSCFGSSIIDLCLIDLPEIVWLFLYVIDLPEFVWLCLHVPFALV